MKTYLKYGMILALLLWSIPAYAANEQMVDFTKALELAVKNNVELKIAALTMENSQIDLQKSELSSNADTHAQRLNLALELAKSKSTYETTRQNVMVGLITDFADLKKKRLAVEITEKQWKLKELELKSTKELFAKRNATETDVKNATLAVDEQKVALSKSKDELEKVVGRLKTKTGLTGVVTFKEITVQVPTVRYEQAKAIAQAETVSVEHQEMEIRYQLALLELEKGQLEKKSELDIKKMTNAKEIARYRLQQSKNDIADQVKNELFNLDQFYTTVQLKSTGYEIAKEDHQKTKLGQQKGYYTEMQVLQSEMTLANAERDLFTAKVDYIVALIQLRHLLGESQTIGGEIK